MVSFIIPGFKEIGLNMSACQSVGFFFFCLFVFVLFCFGLLFFCFLGFFFFFWLFSTKSSREGSLP